MKFAMLALAAAFLASCAPQTPATRIAANPTKYDKLSSSHQILVRQGQIDQGMSADAVSMAWGTPSRRYDGQEGGVHTSQWDYAGSRPVYSTGYFGSFGYGRYSPYGRYGSRFGYGLHPEITYVPYRKASVWFRNGRVSKWERVQ